MNSLPSQKTPFWQRYRSNDISDILPIGGKKQKAEGESDEENAGEKISDREGLSLTLIYLNIY